MIEDNADLKGQRQYAATHESSSIHKDVERERESTFIAFFKRTSVFTSQSY